jgi:RNA polymerase sigma factor for flagellar operon FliA
MAEDPLVNAPQQFMYQEASEKLRTLVARLPFAESRLIQLVYFEGYTLQESASQLGFSKSWASRLHARILEQLAAEMRRLDLHD